MIKQHAERHLDRLKFPTNQGKDYIIERGKYTKMAYGRLQKNWNNAEDAVQETYLSIMEYPPKSEMNEEAFEAFFSVVLNGVIGKMFRNEKSQEKSSVTPAGKYLQYSEVETNDEENNREEIIALPDEETNPESAYLAGETLERIKKEIGKLDFNPRNVVALSVLYGYKPREIVQITGISSSNVRSYIKRFRAQMKEKMN